MKLYLIGFISAIFVACAGAEYRVIENKAEQVSGEPKKVTSENSPFDELAKKSKKKFLPTAAVEVILDGKRVVETLIGARVELRPSADTLDYDFVDLSSCRNPGIKAVQYYLNGSKIAEVSRNRCDSLSAYHSFPAAGKFEVKMVVTSIDNEIAESMMTMNVKSSASQLANLGFVIEATPLIQVVNKSVEFRSYCYDTQRYQIDWNLGDNTTKAGLNVDHSYDASASYSVQSECKSSVNTQKAAISILIIESKDLSTKNFPARPSLQLPANTKYGPNQSSSTGSHQNKGSNQSQ